MARELNDLSFNLIYRMQFFLKTGIQLIKLFIVPEFVLIFEFKLLCVCARFSCFTHFQKIQKFFSLKSLCSCFQIYIFSEIQKHFIFLEFKKFQHDLTSLFYIVIILIGIENF